jgi:hypothetical protein
MATAKTKPAAKKAAPAKKPAAKAKPKAAAPARPGKKLSLAEQLTPKAERFAHEYLIDLNATQAYLRAFPGVKASTANVEGCRLLANPSVAAFIASERAKTAKKLEITREALLAEIWNVVIADPRELVSHIVLCCRHCHGIGHAHQWKTQEEFEVAHETALVEYEKKRASRRPGEPEPTLRLPSDAGGFGFDPRLEPHPDCPECLGAGRGRTFIKDTRNLSPQAAALYAGIKETEKGIEVKMHSKLDAAEKIARHLGIYEKDNEQKGKGLGDMLTAFAAGIHSRQGGRLPIAAPKATADLKPPLGGQKGKTWK